MALRTLIQRVPPPVWLGGIVAASFVTLAFGGTAMAQPVVFADELHYSGAGERLGGGDLPVSEYGYGLAYPLLIAPLYAFLPGPPEAYVAIKLVNGVVFSLSALPAYALARRGARPGFALVAALLTVLIPARTTSYLVLTESLAYVLFLVAALLVVRSLERPTAARQLVALGACALAVEARRQLVVLIVAIPLAIVVFCRTETETIGGALRLARRRFTTMWVVLATGVAALLALSLAHPGSPLGPYETLIRGYDPIDITRWLRNHVATLGVLCAVVPLAALPFGLRECARRGALVGRRAIGALTVTFGVLALLEVAAFSSTPFGLERMHERYLIYVLPLVFCVFAVWLDAGMPRPRPAAAIVAACVTLLPLLLPSAGATNTVTDGPTLFALGLDAAASPGTVDVAGLELRAFHVVAVAASALLALWFLLVHRRLAPFVIGAVVAVLVLVNVRAHSSVTDFSRDLEAATTSGAGSTRSAWLDDATTAHDRVTSLFVAPPLGCASRAVDVARGQIRHARAEFFTTRLTRVIAVGGAPDTALPSSKASIGPTGRIESGGEPVSANLVLVDARLVLRGTRLATDPGGGLSLWRIRGPLTLAPGSATDVCSAPPPS